MEPEALQGEPTTKKPDFFSFSCCFITYVLSLRFIKLPTLPYTTTLDLIMVKSLYTSDKAKIMPACSVALVKCTKNELCTYIYECMLTCITPLEDW
jgi:hypothetical protein